MASWLTDSKYLLSPFEDFTQSPASPGGFSPLLCSDDGGLLGDIPPLELSITPRNPVKKRKTTYYNRKEEAEELTKLIQELEEQLRQMETRHVKRQLPLRASLVANSLLLTCVEQSRRTIATTQSMIGSCASYRNELPLGSFIHLPKDVALRQQIVQDMKPQRIHDAVQYLLQRCQFLDIGSPSRQLEHFVTGNGDHVSLHWEVAVFDEDSPSVATVFSDMMYFVHNEEMELMEKLGIMSVCESDALHEDSNADQVRTVTTHREGLLTEKNVVMHSQFFQQSELHSQPHGVLTVDFVNEDDTFPYQPESRIRKDVVSAALVVEVPPMYAGNPSRVALVRWASVKIHNSPLAPCHTLEQLSRESVAADFDVMVEVIRDRNAWRHLAGVFI